MEKNVPIGKRIVDHVRRHKVKYIIGGACLIIGGLIGRHVSVQRHEIMKSLGNTVVNNTENIMRKTENIVENNINIVNLLGRNGHPGNVIYCNETKQVFKSHREACRELGIDNRDLWAYIKRLKPTARGFTFTSVGEASNRALNQ